MNEKIKLVYIASNGRSGSTILDLLLGAHSACCTLGEFYVLPWELRTSTKPCGCGERVEGCPFWGPIIEQTRPVLLNGFIERFRDTYHTGRTIRWGELAFLRSSSPRHVARRKVDLEQYGRDNEEVLHRVLEQARQTYGTQVAWLVDSSKSPYRLLWLKETKRFDLRVIHLVKDPRAFVFSYCKGNQTGGYLRLIAKATGRWNVENYLIDRLLKAHFQPPEVLRLRYDELAGNPDATMARISSWLGIVHEPTLTEKLRQQNHGISGNPSRFEAGPIRLDEKWRKELGPMIRACIRAASFPLSNQYGFPWAS